MHLQRWLHTDFRQERRWKIATAFALAKAVKAWHRASPTDRVALCITRRTHQPRPVLSSDDRVVGVSASPSSFPSTPTGTATPRRSSKDIARTRLAATVAASVTKTDEENSEMDVDADGEEVDAEGETERNSAVESDERNAMTGAATSSGQGATSTSIAVPSTSASDATSSVPIIKTPVAPNQTDTAQQAQQAKDMIELMTLRAPIFELPVSATTVDPALLSHLAAPTSESLSLDTFFPDLPLYADFSTLDMPEKDKRVEESSVFAGRLANVSKYFDSRPMLVSTINPARTRGLNGGWDPMTNNWLDETKESVGEGRPERSSVSSTFSSLALSN